MNRQTVYKSFLSILALCCMASLFAQSRITVKARANRTSILIGEPIELRLTADIPENEAIGFFSIDSIPHFEFLAMEKIDTVNTSSGTVLSQLIRLTSFDSGRWTIPSFIMAGSVATDSIVVDVGFSAFNPEQEYHDIKDVLDVTVEEKKRSWWWYAAGALVVAAAAAIYLLRKKKPVVAAAEVPADPFEEAMRQLDRLRKNKPPAKAYYSAAVDIFRQYVFHKKGIHSLQKTTDDLVQQLKPLAIGKEINDRLVQVLRLGDFVKFAKYEPSADDDQVLLEGISDGIKAIEQGGV